MNSREIITRNLEFSHPERIGLSFDRERINDFYGMNVGPSDTWEQRRWVEGNVEYYDDEWGNVWHRLVDMGAGGEVYQPVLQEWSALDDYELPDMANPARYAHVQEVFAQVDDRYRTGWLPGFPFAICRYMRKMEVYFIDLIASFFGRRQ